MKYSVGLFLFSLCIFSLHGINVGEEVTVLFGEAEDKIGHVTRIISQHDVLEEIAKLPLNNEKVHRLLHDCLEWQGVTEDFETHIQDYSGPEPHSPNNPTINALFADCFKPEKYIYEIKVPVQVSQNPSYKFYFKYEDWVILAENSDFN